MTSIQIYNPQGYAYEANWNGSELFHITDSCERIANVMGEDCVRLVFELPNKVVFDAFAYIVYNGQTFFLKEQYIPTPDGTFMEDSGEISTAYYSYDVKFVSVGNMLDKFICYRHVKVTNAGEWDEPEININGNLETLYVIIMGSIQQASNRLKAQYGQLYFADLLDTIVANGLDGNMPNTDNVKLTANTNLLTFNFSGDNIANVCTTVANSFTNDDKKDTEWYIVENNGSLTLHFAKCVDVEYGVQYVSDYISNNNSADSFARPQKSGGLKKVEYSQAWSGITNVIVPYGSTRNMSYQAAKGIDEITQMQSTFGKRLRLIPNTSYNVKDKEGNEVIITTDSHGAIRNNYVDTGIEQVKFYDEIYPQGHFRVTSVETKNKRQDGEIVPEYTVSGIAIDSKGNEIQPAEGFYPISIEEGTTLSVRFEKGLLNGREFEIANKTRKDEGATTYSLKFTIVADGSIEDGTLIPSGNFIPRDGDEFALFNMKMPEVYITAAQQELAQRAYDELVELQTSRPQVKCTTDPTSWDKPIALGYQFKVMSELFNSEESFISRVTSYSYKLTKPYDVQFTLASAIMQGTLSQMNDLISDVTHQAGGLEQRAINLSRRGWRDAAEMAEMVDSLAADMMLVGNEKYQFAFTAGIEIVNSNNQTTAIKIGEGTLQHTQDPYISDYTCQGCWSHGAVTINNGNTENGSAALTSVPDTPFYLYAVVGQNSTDISFELQDKEQDGEAYLLFGILSSAFTDTISGVTTNYRVFNRTNGYTQISGGTITTEQIQDAGRNLIIDFQSNPPRIIARNGAEIIGNIKFKASDEMTAEEQLAALGIDVGNAISAAEAAAQVADTAQAEAARALGSISNLQEQIDGEVTSWFLEGEPWDNYRPADQWTDQTLKDRHLGDTYTNILPIEADLSELDANGNPMWFEQGSLRNGSGTLTFGKLRKEDTTFIRTKTLLELKPSGVVITFPTAVTGSILYFRKNKTTSPLFVYYFTNATSITLGAKGSASYAYYFALDIQTSSVQDVIGISCDETFTNPEAGKSWRWCNNDDTNASTYHWHLIADSDATKALAEAAKASAAADGKSKTFVVKPTNYAVGDLWILQSDTDHADGKKGDMLTANAASEIYDASHWSKEVKYTDDTAIENLEIGGRNLVSANSDNWKRATVSESSDKGSTYDFVSRAASTTRITIKELVQASGKIYVKIHNSGYDTCITQFDSSKLYLGKDTFVTWTSDTLVELDMNTSYIGVTVRKSDNSSITTEEIGNVKIKIEQGTKPTDWTPSTEDVDAKVSALDYLKDALTDGSTEIAGGLTMTNVLMLKNLDGEVTAGMSGLTKHENKEDKVLMWGGGTYEEAYAAANSENYYKSGTTPITTLLKKDGTGKIGIFKISDTQAIVDVPNQGKVIIDASTTNGGIRVLNSSGRINAALLPTSISSFKPLADNSVTGSEQSVYYSMSTQSVTSTSKTITLPRTGSFTTSGTTTETLEQYTKKTTITTASTRVGGNTVTLNGNIRTSNHDMFVRVTCELLYNGNSIYSINHTEEVQVGYNYISLSNVNLSFPNSITKALTVSNSINMQLKVTVTITGASSGAYIDTVSLNVSMGSIYMFYKSTTAITYTYPPQTIIGTDGLISLVNNSKYFMVDNSGSTQKIYAKGLSTTKGSTAGSGELYISNYSNAGLIKTLYDGFAAISEVLEHCKYEGSNSKAQDNAKNACDNIRSALSQISIIANT